MEGSTELKRQIGNLHELAEELPEGDKLLFDRFFRLVVTVGDLVAPEEMRPWIENYFGSVEAVQLQKIVKVMNKLTYEGALFNELRAQRPIECKIGTDLEAEIRKTQGGPFCRPETSTPADSFGRVRGKHCVTASNIAKYDGYHGLVVFDDHNPLVIDRDRFDDYVETGVRWAEEAMRRDPSSQYLFFMWNCLWKGGASIPHGHAQVTLSKQCHYAKIEHLRQVSLAYREQFRGDYFEDLFAIHRSLGLGKEFDGVFFLSYLTPVKEKEILLWGPSLSGDLKSIVFRALDCYRRTLGVVSFNLVIWMPPLGQVEEDWSRFPVIVRMVDRGDPMNRTSDVGAMELYASSVIASDPFTVADTIIECLESSPE